MDTQDIKTLLDKIKSLRIAVYGDFTLDAYWVLDPRKSEISVETGLQAEAVGKQNFSLGGAANVVDASPDDIFPAEKVRTFAENLYKMYSRPVFISRGNRGLIAFDKNGYTDIPGLQFLNKTDSVGTGDTADETLYHKVTKRVIDFIDKSTGIQTCLMVVFMAPLVISINIQKK